MTKTTVSELGSKVTQLENENKKLTDIVSALTLKLNTLEEKLQSVVAKQSFADIIQKNQARLIDDNEQYSR